MRSLPIYVDYTPKAHGSSVSDDFVLAGFYAGAHTLRLDETHREAIAKPEPDRQRAQRLGRA